MVWLTRLMIAALFLGVVSTGLRNGPPKPVETEDPGGAEAPALPRRDDSNESGVNVPKTVSGPASLNGRCRVVDGDTIIIGGQSIRLAGIDAPELDHPYGEKARWALVGLCRGQTVRAEFDGSSTYSRLVATCYLPDGRDLGAEMVRLGHAVDWKKYSGGRYRHLEVAGIRKRLWRCDARQKGRFPPPGSARAG